MRGRQTQFIEWKARALLMFKRHCDLGNSQSKIFTWGWLTVLRFRPHCHHEEKHADMCAGVHDAREETKDSHSGNRVLSGGRNNVQEHLMAEGAGAWSHLDGS